MAVDFERAPISDQPLSAILAYESSEGVAAFVNALVQLLNKRQKPYELLLFGRDPGAASGPNVRYFEFAANASFGLALASGLTAAIHPLVLTMPADAGYDAESVAKFLEQIDQVDVACGQHAGRSWLTWLREGFWAWLLLGVPVQDPLCPVRLYRRTILERLDLQAQGKFVEVELLAKTNFLNAIMIEVEIARPARAVVTKDASWGRDWRTVLFGPRFLPTPSKPETAN